MKWIIAPDVKDALDWLDRHPLKRGENYRIITEQVQAEGEIMYSKDVIYVNHLELDRDLLSTVEDNIQN